MSIKEALVTMAVGGSLLSVLTLVLLPSPPGAAQHVQNAGVGPASMRTAVSAPTPSAAAVPVERSQVITLGDIDADEPAKKIERFQPLADYLAQHLQELGISESRVVIARDTEEMAYFLRSGKVDIYFDNPFPTLKVQDLSGSEIVLRRWKGGAPTYWSVYIARLDSGIARIEDFAGKVVAFEDPYSTSGFVLPAGTLVQRGLALSEVNSHTAPVVPDEVGYLFSRDAENTVEMVLRGLVAGGGLSNQDYEELPPEFKEQIIVFDRTVAVPRQLVSVRPGLSPELAKKVRELLIGLNQTEEGRQILKGFKKTAKFDALPPESQEAVDELQLLMELVTER